jgi:hypothetical protein
MAVWKNETVTKSQSFISWIMFQIRMDARNKFRNCERFVYFLDKVANLTSSVEEEEIGLAGEEMQSAPIENLDMVYTWES